MKYTVQIVNAKEDDGWTPLHGASGNGHDTGADVNAKEKDDRTPIHRASENGHDMVVQQLQSFLISC